MKNVLIGIFCTLGLLTEFNGLKVFCVLMIIVLLAVKCYKK
jgi:glucose-6-phosphate-specific signal transduction histidine kinase